MSEAHIVARDQLRSFIERIERLEAEKQTIADDIKDVYGEAKSTGFDTKILRKVISIRKQDTDERLEQEAILATYLSALGMIQMDMFNEPEEDHDPTTGELRSSAPVNPRLIKQVVDGVQTETGRAALLTVVDIMIEREEAEERSSDGGLDIVTKHTEIASASQGEAEDYSDQRETDREAAATGVGANEGGDDVDGGAVRADPYDQEELEPTGPVAEWAPNTPETAHEMDRDEMRGGNAVHSVPAEKGREAIPAGPEGVHLTHADAGEIPAPSFLTKPPTPLRPHCQRPENCGGYGRTHCGTCLRAKEREMA